MQLLKDLINIYLSIPYHMGNFISNKCTRCKQKFSLDDTISQLQGQNIDLKCAYLTLDSKISTQLNEIASKDKILEEYLLQYTKANHFVGCVYGMLQDNPMLGPTICGLLLAFIIFYFFTRNIDLILFYVQTAKQYILQLTCWVCLRSQDLDVQITILNSRIEDSTTVNVKLEEISTQLTNHIEHLDCRVDHLAKQVEKCDWTSLLNITIFNDQFIVNTIASTCLFIIPLLVAFAFIESNRQVNDTVNFVRTWFYRVKF